jgi:nucleoside-diphosphate-sugar epimerase
MVIKRCPEKNSYRGRPVLITGGCGFMGINLAERLIHMDAAVKILDLEKPCAMGQAQSIIEKVDFYQGDIGMSVS